MTTPVPWSMKKLAADARAGVDVDAGRAVRELGDDARDERHAEPVELVRDAVVGDGGDARVAEDGLVGARRRRGRPRRRRARRCRAARAPRAARAANARVDVGGALARRSRSRRRRASQAKQQAAPHLLLERDERGVERVADVVVGCPRRTRSAAPKCAGKSAARRSGDDRRERLARRQRAAARARAGRGAARRWRRRARRPPGRAHASAGRGGRRLRRRGRVTAACRALGVEDALEQRRS